jgi:3-deoxy-D-manno-octulosonic-acid transferase
MMTLLYNGILLLFLLLSLPKILFLRATKGKYRNVWKNKNGKNFDDIARTSSPLFWIHGVSVGETKAVQHLASLLKERYPESQMIVTTTTETGLAEGKRSLPFANHHLFLPFDFSWIIRPIVQKLKPDLVILSETDYWLNFLTEAKQSGGLVAVVNAKLSEISFSRYGALQKFGMQTLINRLFSQIDYFCTQNPLYSKRLCLLGIPSEKITATGNLKLDASPETLSSEEILKWHAQLKIASSDLVLVAGSTHPQEEALILQAFLILSTHFPSLKLILVPRHPERFDEVGALITTMGLPFARFSKLDQMKGNEKVVLIDAMGKLKACYQLASLAIVCGSFVSHVGGHNILEPSAYGVPVLFGPYMHTQTEFLELINKYEGGIQVNKENLIKTLSDLLQSSEKRKKLSEGGKRLTQDLQGASERTLDLLEKKLKLSDHFRLHENQSLR